MSSGNLENFVIYFSWSWKLILQKINFKLQKLLSIWVFYSTSKSSIIYGSIEEAMKSTSITCYNMCSQLLPKPFCTIYPKVRILSDCRFTILFTVFMVLYAICFMKRIVSKKTPQLWVYYVCFVFPYYDCQFLQDEKSSWGIFYMFFIIVQISKPNKLAKKNITSAALELKYVDKTGLNKGSFLSTMILFEIQLVPVFYC